jgi:hypothetical protein
MLVYGSYNALNQTLRQLYSEETNPSADHPHRTVSYKTLKGNWFVVSGIEEGRVFYQKTMLAKGIFKTFRSFTSLRLVGRQTVPVFHASL